MSLKFYKVTQGYIFYYNGNGYCNKTKDEMFEQMTKLVRENNYSLAAPFYVGYGVVCLLDDGSLVSVHLIDENNNYRRIS